MGHDTAASDLGSLAALLRRIAATPGGSPLLEPGVELAQRYTVLRFLGRGGMGAVYAVRDAELDDVVALKLLHPELGTDPGYQQRLRAEVRLARRVSHPNVCRVHDLGQDGGRLFVTMELVRGRSLRQALREPEPENRPDLSVMIDLVVQIASALTAAHRAGVLHRDVKPDNVVDGHRAVLTDFGVASLAHDQREQVVAGTAPYIAPEVLRGEAFDHRADVYSTAVLAYELLAGTVPFPARSLDEATRLAVHRPPTPPMPERLGGHKLRAAIDRAFVRALDPDPANRIATAEQLAESLAHAARGAPSTMIAPPPVSGEPPPSTAPMSTSTIRRPELRVATALVYRSDGMSALSSTSASGEDLERIVIAAGGTPIAVSALEIGALFGVPASLGDDAERAARAAQALIAHRAGSAGLDTVRVVLRPGAAILATPDALESASTLAGAAGTNQILASPVTARQLAARFDIASIEVGGASARRVVGARPPAPGSDAATFRGRELAALEILAEECFARRRPRHGEIRAPAGFGKTQLRDALIARLRARREIDWLVARATPHGDDGPLGLLRAADPEWYAAAERAGLADRTAAFAAARRWLEQRAERRPVAVVLDDVQWADEVSRAFIDQLIGALEDVPVLLTTFIRTGDDTAELPHGPRVQVIRLGPLDPAAASGLVRDLAPGAPADAVARVVARAAGHPFFLEELAREMAERGDARGITGPLPATIEAVIQARLDRLDAGCSDLILAAAVIGVAFWRDALIATLDDHDARGQDDTIDPAGLRPPPARLASLVDARLAELERLALIAPATAHGIDTSGAGGERYRFVHALVRDVAYARLAPRERRAAHIAVAAWLAQRFPALATLASLDRGRTSDTSGHLDLEIVAAFAHHLEEAGDQARAAIAHRAAGVRWLGAAAYGEAALALRRAAALLPAVDVELATDLGDALLQAETLTEAEIWYQRALDLTRPDDDAGRALRWHKLGNAATRRADNTRAIQCFEAGLALAAPGGVSLAPWATRDPRTAALLFGSLGWVAGYQLGDNDRGLPACQRAVDLLEGTPYRSELAHALSRLGATFMRASRFRDQLACNRRNLEIGLEIGDLNLQLTARINLGVVHGLIGEITEAIGHTEIARGLAGRSGARDAAGLIASNLGGLYLECGRLDDAQRCLDEGLLLAERAGSRAGLTETYGFCARLRAARADLAGAERWARQSLALADDLGLRLDQGIALRLIAQIIARSDAVAAAIAIAEASSRMAGLDAYEEARTEAARARILRRTGDVGAAEPAHARALAELTRLGARRELEVIDLLDEVR